MKTLFRLLLPALFGLFFTTSLQAQLNVDSDMLWSELVPQPDSTTSVFVRTGAILTIDVDDAVCNILRAGRAAGDGTVVFQANSQLTVLDEASMGRNNNSTTGNGLIDMSAGGTLICGNLRFFPMAEPNTLNQGNGSSVTVLGAVTIEQPATDNVANVWQVDNGTATVSGLISLTGVNTTASRDARIRITTGTLNANGGIFFAGSTAATKVINLNNSGTINIGGSGISGNLGASTFNHMSAGTVNYTGAGSQTIGAYAYYNLTVSGNGTKTLQGAASIAANATMSLQGTAAFNDGGSSFTYGANATLEYASLSPQITTNEEYKGGGNAPANLTINNSSGVTLTANRTVTGTLSLLSGTLTTSSPGGLLTLGNTATVVGGSSTSFVNGPLRKNGNTAFTFPVGKTGARYAPIAISAPDLTSDAFTAEYFAATPPAGTLGGGIDHISELEYWTLDRVNGAADVFVTLSWDASSNVTDPSALLVARRDMGTDTWVDEGNGGTTGDATAGTVTSAAAVSTFSPFTLGSSTAANPLPVELLSFTATPKNGKVALHWRTASESGNARFVVEKSADLQNYIEVATVAGAGDSNQPRDYSAEDLQPFSGTSYYRLRQVDFDGDEDYSDLVRVDYEADNRADFAVFPNPASREAVSIKFNQDLQDNVVITVFDARGQLILRETPTTVRAGQIYTLEGLRHVAPGAYFIIITSGNQRIQKKLVIADTTRQ